MTIGHEAMMSACKHGWINYTANKGIRVPFRRDKQARVHEEGKCSLPFGAASGTEHQETPK